MTPLTALELKFADGDYLFDLKLPQLAELQRVCGNVGIFTIYGRLLKGRYLAGDTPIALPEDGAAHVEDIFEVVRLGLIGGGKGIVNGQEVPVSALRARQLVEAYCHSAPLRESWSIAAAVMAARVEGFVPPEDKKKAEPRAEKRRTSSTSRRSRTLAPKSAPIGEN